MDTNIYCSKGVSELDDWHTPRMSEEDNRNGGSTEKPYFFAQTFAHGISSSAQKACGYSCTACKVELRVWLRTTWRNAMGVLVETTLRESMY